MGFSPRTDLMPSTNVLSFAKATNKTRQSVYIKRINDVVMFFKLNDNEKLKVLSSPSSFLLLSLLSRLSTCGMSGTFSSLSCLSLCAHLEAVGFSSF